MRIAPNVKKYVTSKNEPIIDIAKAFCGNYGVIQSFVTEEYKVPDVYLMTKLHKWCDNEVDLYKVDFYECEKDSVEGGDWWLCLKRQNNGPFKYEDLPAKIRSSLENVFAEADHNNFTRDKKSICLMTLSNPKEVAQKLRDFLMDLENR